MFSIQNAVELLENQYCSVVAIRDTYTGVCSPWGYQGFSDSNVIASCSNGTFFSDFFFPGFLLFKDYCMNEIDEAVPQLKFYEEVSCILQTLPTQQMD